MRHSPFRILLLLSLLLWPALSRAQVNGGVAPYTFVAGQPIRAAEVNANFAMLFSGAFPVGGGSIGSTTFSGTLLFTPDATFDIGQAASARPKDVFISRDIAVGRNATIAGTADVTGAGSFLGGLSGDGFSFADTSGNATLSGTLAVAGTSTLSTLTVTDATDLKGVVSDSTGNLTLTDNVDLTGTLAVTGAATVSTTLGVTGLATLSGGATIPTTQSLATAYTSGWAGSGYHLGYNTSYANQAFLELDRLSVRGIFSVYELLVHQIRATNGSIFVANTGKAKTVTGSGPYTIDTEDVHGFAVNDIIRAQRFTGTGTYQSDLTVTSVPTTTQFIATLRATYTPPAAGMDFVRIGNTSDVDRQGSIYLTADDTNAPYINVLDDVAAFTDWGTTGKTKVRVGNLNGSYGYASNIYGFGAGDVADEALTVDATNGVRFLQNSAVLGSLSSSLWRLGSNTEEHVEIDSTSMRFEDGSGTAWASLSGTSFTLGDTAGEHILIDTALRFKNAGTEYGSLSGSTWTLGPASGAPRVEITSSAVNLKNSSGTNVISLSGATGTITGATVQTMDQCGTVSATGCVLMDGTSLRWYNDSAIQIGAIGGTGITLLPTTNWTDTGRSYKFSETNGSFGLYANTSGSENALQLVSATTNTTTSRVRVEASYNTGTTTSYLELWARGTGVAPYGSATLSSVGDLSLSAANSRTISIGAGDGESDINLDLGTLFVDAASNFVGINDATPSYPLDVTGTARFTGLTTTSGGVLVNGSAGVGAAATAGTFSYDGTTLTQFTGDGTGYSWQLAKRSGSVTTPFISLTDNATAVTFAGDIYATGFRVASPSNVGTTAACLGNGGANSFLGTCTPSSRRYKMNITPAETDWAQVLKVEPVWFQLRPEVNASREWHFGAIAEEVDALGLSGAVQYDAEGRPERIYYDKIALYLIPLVKAQQQQLEALERRLLALEQK
jgi:hypothetical protein